MLEPAVRAHVEASTGERLDTDDRTQLRQAATREIDRMFERFGLPGPEVERVADHEVPVVGGSILVRSYHPHAGTPVAGHVYLHGGGWTSGSIHERVCDATARHRAVASQCVTFLVEYRLAPEFRFPTAVGDVVSTVRWVRDHATAFDVDPARITLGGASAGANLAAAAVLADPDLSLRGLLLEVPALDLRHGGTLDVPDGIDADDATWLRQMQDDYRTAVTTYLTHVDDGSSHSRHRSSPPTSRGSPRPTSSPPSSTCCGPARSGSPSASPPLACAPTSRAIPARCTARRS